MFKVGQRLVCIKAKNWRVGFGPKKDEIVTCDGDNNEFTGNIGFYEYPESRYDPKYFEPVKLDYDFVEEAIKQVKPEKIEI